MARPPRVETVRRALAEFTGALEDASLIAAEDQAAPDITDARRTCERLIAALEVCLGRLQRLRRRLGCAVVLAATMKVVADFRVWSNKRRRAEE